MRPGAALVLAVRRRAEGRCEYCRFPELAAVLPFEVEHIIAQKHGGLTTEENLALACFYCNRYKGPNVAALDPASGEAVRLFHPRLDEWADHFAWLEEWLEPRSAIGRVTVEVLRMNNPNALAVRRELMRGGLW